MESIPTRKSRLRYLRVLLYLVPVAALVLGYATVIVATGESYPFTIVTGTSMRPTILPGSVALIDKVPFNQLNVGDVIVFTPQLAELYHCDSSPGSSLSSESLVPCYVIHRIVAINHDSNGNRILQTKGDNNSYSLPEIDTNINSSMYVGKVVLEFPLAGYITEAPYNEVISLIILGVLVGEIFFERNQSRQKKDLTESRPASDQQG